MSDLGPPRILVFQCQYSVYSETEREAISSQLPPHVKHVQVPCSGRISPLFVLNAIQGGVDGVLICGCVPEKCHFKAGNLGARRQLDAFRSFLSYLGVEEERVRFAWIDPAERGRILQEIATMEEVLSSLDQASRLVTRVPFQPQGESQWAS
jgi:F420-non-reducing hydrogenase iron-sulfur subunit